VLDFDSDGKSKIPRSIPATTPACYLDLAAVPLCQPTTGFSSHAIEERRQEARYSRTYPIAAGFAESQDGGYFSNFGNAGFIWSHGCASDVHTSTCGLNQLGSSKLAVLIATNWGTESGLTTIGEPQSGQKPRRVLPPISLGEAWKRSEPCKSLKASVGTMTKDENGPPLDCWQSRQ
jgi:hypothetical protein